MSSTAPVPSGGRAPEGSGGSAPGGRRTFRQPDLGVRTFPLVSAEEWRRPEEVLRRMYLEAEERAVEAYTWYMRDRVRKRVSSKVVRGAAIVLAAAGGLQPLASAAGAGGGLGWGYVLLASAGVCVAFDHFLGLSSRWMRNMVCAQEIRSRLHDFQLDWAVLNARDAAGQGPIPVEEYLELLRAFITDLSATITRETGEWVTEFQSGLAQLNPPPGQK
ncbi:SLATT domain-containing protein [Streptosporangium longisporum]|uniref:SMODS and SLOG-associating 2TM effector domain-containing protein n=1 Tax=Streptosporangium longisporum TaxID=46187 RepID=A0ABP6L5U6_9ACTN